MSDTGSPVRARKTDEDDFWPDDRPGLSRRTKMIGLGVALVVVVAAVVVVAVASFTGGDTNAASGGGSVLPTVYVPTAANEGTKKLNLRAGGDQRPLNEGEVFTDEAKSVSHGKYTFSLVRSEVSGNCRAAVWGDRLKADLQKFGCTQVVRGAYRSTDQRYVGQFVALNLDRIEGSEQIVRDLDPQVNGGFTLPLAANGLTNFGAGFSAAYPEIYGHYVVISWVQRKGGARPDSMNELLDASLAIERAADFVWGRLVLADN
ncbi:hypothetical protein ACRYCC_40220 [Actinomadura scrupuli]|uniref:hypothetical protein n=1 Tax=Actinomadura scrupuli TaxID=559629 RepID=UPI003D963047